MAADCNYPGDSDSTPTPLTLGTFGKRLEGPGKKYPTTPLFFLGLGSQDFISVLPIFLFLQRSCSSSKASRNLHINGDFGTSLVAQVQRATLIPSFKQQSADYLPQIQIKLTFKSTSTCLATVNTVPVPPSHQTVPSARPSTATTPTSAQTPSSQPSSQPSSSPN